MVWCIVNHGKAIQSNSVDHRTDEQLIAQFLKASLACFRIFKHGDGDGDGDGDGANTTKTKSSSTSVTKKSTIDENEVLDQFASVFTVLDLRVFQNVISAHMDLLFDEV